MLNVQEKISYSMINQVHASYFCRTNAHENLFSLEKNVAEYVLPYNTVIGV